MKKEIKVTHFIKPAVFVFFAIILEIVNFLWIDFTITGNSSAAQILPTYFLIDLCFFFVIAAIMFISNRVVANVIFYVFLGFQLLINMVNATLSKVFGDIFSFDMMKLGGEAVAAFKFDFIDFGSIIVNLLILGVVITVQVLLDKMPKTDTLVTPKKRLAVLCALFCTFFVGSSVTFAVQTNNFKDSDANIAVMASDQYLWDNMHLKLEAYKKFGTYGFYAKSLSDMIYHDDNMTAARKRALKQKVANNTSPVDTNAVCYGDNLIVILLESFEWFAIDPYNTPTLWDIKTNQEGNGIALENFHGKNKTNVSEDISILGNMPKSKSMNSLAKDGYLNTKYTLPNMLKAQGYDSVNYFHSYKKTFYNREEVNKAMGFDNVYGLEDANLADKSEKFNEWNLDSDYVKAMIEKIVPEEGKFFSFFTTVTTHGSYSKENERFASYYDIYDANLNLYKQWLEANGYFYPEEEKIQFSLRQYKSAAIDTDVMVKYLLDYLQTNGKLDNTTIVMYSDHNCYYDDLYTYIKGTNKEEFYDTNNYKIPAMIYSKKLADERKSALGVDYTNTISDFTNTYDLYPTICKAMGLPYSTTLTHGYDVFSEEIENSIMASYLTGAFNQSYYTLNIVDIYKTKGEQTADLRTFKENVSMFYEKQLEIELIYKYGLAI